MKKYVTSSILLILLLAFTLPITSLATESETTTKEDDDLNLATDATSAVLMERDTGTILFNKNSHERLPPASMTKLMTLLLVMEAIDKDQLALDEMIRISENASSMGGSQLFLEAGEEMSVEELLKGVAIASGNDASVALAERVSGTEDTFVKHMNDKADKLGLKDTHFENTTGLPAKNHYSSAHDLAMISKALLRYESITDYTSIYEDYLREGQDNEFWLVNTNKLVKSYDGVDGLKTGFTNEAKYGLTATAQKNGMRVISVVMGADSPKKRNSYTADMLDYAFNQFKTKNIFAKGDHITSLKLLKAEHPTIKVVTSNPVSLLHQTGETTEDISTDVSMEEDIQAPLDKGEQVGTLIVKKGGDIVSKTPLIVEEAVHKASFFTLWKRNIKQIVKND